MKQKKLLTMLVLLAAVVSGAWAQDPAKYKITVAEGTEDVGNWNVPTEAAEGAKVTATYSGDRKVKSVKAVKKGGCYHRPLDADGRLRGAGRRRADG